MARDYEDDNDDRRNSGSSGTKTVLIILGIVGGLVVLGVVGCVGVFGFVMYKATGQIKGIVGSTTAAQGFVQNLSSNNIDGAYAQTSAGYKAKMNRTQFEEFLKKNPLCTKHAYHTSNRVNLPDGKTQPVATISYTLHETAPTGAMVDDPDEDEDNPKPTKETPPPAGSPKTISITLKLIEENNQWVVDDVTIP